MSVCPAAAYRIAVPDLGPVYMEWGTPVWWGWFLLFSRSGGHKTKETYPTRPGSPTPCKQGLRVQRRPSRRMKFTLRTNGS